MNPGFGMKESRALVPIFTKFAMKVRYACCGPCYCCFFTFIQQLSNKWKGLILASSNQEMVFDLTNWISKATLDAMGLGMNNSLKTWLYVTDSFCSGF